MAAPMIHAGEVSAALVTRGDVDLAPILESLPYDDVVIWDNSKREDLHLYGRYAAFAECQHQVVYVQDDDHVLRDQQGLLDAYEPGVIVSNMSPGWARNWDCHDHAFVGKGALIDVALPPPAFERYLERWPADELFYHWADPIVTVLNPVRLVELEVDELPWGYAPNRMNTRPHFRQEKFEVTRRARQIRDRG